METGMDCVFYIYLAILLLFACRFDLAVVLLIPKLVELFNNPVQLIVAVKTFSQRIMDATGIELYNGDSLQNATKKIAGSLPSFLTGTANFITNLLLMFFVLYYMLVHGTKMEKFLNVFYSLKRI